jgi:hypothetical protein
VHQGHRLVAFVPVTSVRRIVSARAKHLHHGGARYRSYPSNWHVPPRAPSIDESGPSWEHYARTVNKKEMQNGLFMLNSQGCKSRSVFFFTFEWLLLGSNRNSKVNGNLNLKMYLNGILQLQKIVTVVSTLVTLWWYSSEFLKSSRARPNSRANHLSVNIFFSNDELKVNVCERGRIYRQAHTAQAKLRARHSPQGPRSKPTSVVGHQTERRRQAEIVNGTGISSGPSPCKLNPALPRPGPCLPRPSSS